jgi:hypothetical protein
VKDVEMAGRPLKYFEDYRDLLHKYAKGSGIKVIYKDLDTYGTYVHDRRELTLCKDMDESTEISALLHELGHADDEVLTNKSLNRMVNKAYPRVYRGKATKKQKKLVLECEKRAWKFGRGLAKKLRIPLGKWYDDQERECLASYKDW